MALRRFSDNPLASTLTGTEIVPGIQGGVDVQMTAQDIADLGGGGGSGDVVGPAGAVNNNLAAFDTTTGKLIKDSGISASSLAVVRNTVSTLATSGSVAVDFSLGDYFTLALAGNVSGFTFSNLPGAGKGGSLMIRIVQDSSARTVAWPASFKWAGGVVGAVSTASGAVDVLAITTFDNGTTWDATLAKAFA